MAEASDRARRLRAGLPQGAGFAILRALGRGQRTVGEIITATGLAQSNVSGHLARFRQRGWVQTQRRGRHIFYQLADPGLAAYMERAGRGEGGLPEEERQRLMGAARDDYLAAARHARSDEAERIIDTLLDAGVAWQAIYLELFAPALRQVGELWQRGELSVAAEHAATAFTLRLMDRLLPRLAPAPEPPVGTLVVACAAGEQHSVGARIVADFFQASGWDVRYLGADLPTEECLAFVRALQPDAVALSVTMDESEPALRRLVAGLHAWRGPARRPLLLAGGSWFDRHPDHGLPLDLCTEDLPALVDAAGRCLQEAAE